MPAHKEGKQDWETPDWLFDHWNEIFSFDVDVCADGENHKHMKYYHADDALCGLQTRWHQDGGKFWMNPPYGRGQVEKWVAKAYVESQQGCLVCALLPVSTSSKWWQNYVTKADLIYFYPKRIKFVGAEGSPSFDNAIVVWGLTPMLNRIEKT